MPKVLADLLKVVDSISAATTLEDAQAAAASFKDDLTEYDTGYNAVVRSKNSEAKGLRDRLKAAELSNSELQPFRETVNKITDVFSITMGDDLEDQIAAIKAKIEAGENAGKSQTELETKLSDLTKQLTKAQQQQQAVIAERDGALTKLADVNTRRQAALRDQALLSALTANKAVRPNEISAMLASKVKIGDDDKLAFINDNEEEISVDEGIKAWLSTRPEFIQNDQRPGSGSAGGAGGGGTPPGTIKATRAQMKDADWYAKNRQAVIEDRVEVID